MARNIDHSAMQLNGHPNRILSLTPPLSPVSWVRNNNYWLTTNKQEVLRTALRAGLRAHVLPLIKLQVDFKNVCMT